MGKRYLALVIILVGAFLTVPLAAQNPVTIAKVGSVTVTTTIPVSGTITVPLPTGASTAALQGVTDTDDASIATGQTAAVSLALSMAYDGSVWRRLTFGTAGTASAQVLTVQGIASMTPFLVAQATAANLNATVVGTGTFAVQAAQSGTWNITNVSGTVSLPTGAATAAKQPALGTAGTASADVITVQGITSMTPLLATVTGSGNFTVVQPTGTNLHAVIDATSTTAVTQATASSLNATVIGSGSAGTAATGVVTIQGIASMTKLLVTPDSVALPANQSVNTSQINGVTPLMGNGVTGTGSQRVTIASDNTAFAVNGTLQTQTDTVMVGGVNIKEINAVTPLMGNGATGTGALRVSIANDSTGVVQPGNTANTTPWLVQSVPGTANGLSTFVLEPAASDNHTNIKNGAGVVYHIVAFNNSATINYFRLYNAATGFNGCNSATGLVWEGHIPASTSDTGFVEDIAQGLTFSTGISLCVTGAYGQTNTTNATASAISLNIGYK